MTMGDLKGLIVVTLNPQVITLNSAIPLQMLEYLLLHQSNMMFHNVILNLIKYLRCMTVNIKKIS